MYQTNSINIIFSQADKDNKIVEINKGNLNIIHQTIH